MATEIYLTDGVVRVTALGNIQPLHQAIDVSRFDQADLLLHLHGVEGTATTFIVTIIGGMSKESEDVWVAHTAFGSLLTPNSTAVLNVPRLFRFMRWKITGFSGATAVSFSIRGMLRSN